MANVILLGGATVGVTAVAKVSQGKPISRVLIGGALYVGLLSLLDMAGGGLASGLATVVLVTAILLNGVPFFSAITRKVGT